MAAPVLTLEEIETFKSLYANLQENFSIDLGSTHPFSVLDNQFKLINPNTLVAPNYNIRIKLKHAELDLIFTKTTYFTQSEHLHFITEIQPWGVVKLNHAFPQTLIRKEDVFDKIRDWFEHMDVDFEEDPAFSSKYFVTSSDKNQINQLLNPAIRKCLLDLELKNPLIELHKNHLLIGYKGVIEHGNIKKMINFMHAIKTLC
jgi:hypothetical protein